MITARDTSFLLVGVLLGIALVFGWLSVSIPHVLESIRIEQFTVSINDSVIEKIANQTVEAARQNAQKERLENDTMMQTIVKDKDGKYIVLTYYPSAIDMVKAASSDNQTFEIITTPVISEYPNDTYRVSLPV